MANTFLAADGIDVGASLHEPDLLDTARKVMADAAGQDCEIILPVDATVATKLEANAPTAWQRWTASQRDEMILDIGPETIAMLNARLDSVRTVVWNGPFGAFEIEPFDTGTNAVARHVASATKSRQAHFGGRWRRHGGGPEPGRRDQLISRMFQPPVARSSNGSRARCCRAWTY
jgi:phosphoglycerate kinase